MSIWKDKDGRFHVSKMVGGRRVHRKLPEDATARDAKRVEALLTESLEADNPVNIPGNPLISEVMTLYMAHAKNLRSAETAEYHARRAGEWAVKYRVSQARAFAAHLLSDMLPVYAPATINRTLGTVKKALHMAWELGRTPEDFSRHIRRLPENNQREVFLTVDQVAKLAEACSPQVATAVWVALLTGARRGEVCKIRAEDIGEDTITIPRSHTKMLKPKVVPIVPALQPHLKNLPLKINYEGVKTGFRRAREAVGMEHVNFHDLRHSCASILLGLGVDLYTVSKILGHASISSTQRYAHLQVQQQRSALEKLSALVQKPKRKKAR